MDKLESMRAFTQVVEAGGFAAAARQMDLSRSQVNKLVINLEEHLQTQLLQRTTRKVFPTDAGRAYYDRCLAILTDLEEAELALTRLHQEPRGSLRINAPMTFGTLHLAPLVVGFMAQYPDLYVELVLNDRRIDPIEEGFDITIRIAAQPPGPGLIAHILAPCPLVVCAAPSYLQQRGVPTHPDDLKQHDCLHYGHRAQDNSWTLVGDEPHTVTINGPLCCNNGEVLRAAALAGLGIVILPNFIVEEDLAAERLRLILADYPPPAINIYALYPVNRHLSAKVTRLVEFLAEKI
ncbi:MULTISPECIES: LysR family transcriptional regulator [Cyanophyceae]|uniref:LysR family transcriptional regulator n=1 Tax=Cyanophyceae TaxID=3028117 RepID=UPI00168A1171|nr:MULTISPECIES: LysR family transcriptional regulator [Cyanophyceae]MBD1915149.1 LysR family transcriptional regulator [Phormidium sp. FACHB-77]MBD2030932.1 LysR family transcriptional regulator [Phormidium sp. FACHB-322]MBD2050721.1 LysR family transcriptional regulator [Leptolyngbya sp. FACHB-60]